MGYPSWTAINFDRLIAYWAIGRDASGRGGHVRRRQLIVILLRPLPHWKFLLRK